MMPGQQRKGLLNKLGGRRGLLLKRERGPRGDAERKKTTPKKTWGEQRKRKGGLSNKKGKEYL